MLECMAKLQMELMLLIVELEMQAHPALSGWAHLGREGEAKSWEHEKPTSWRLALNMEGSSESRNVL